MAEGEGFELQIPTTARDRSFDRIATRLTLPIDHANYAPNPPEGVVLERVPARIVSRPGDVPPILSSVSV